ncbi:hypothetical protein [Cellulosimicrobium composti]|uniref:Nuclear transport factor 2 family protein n=1 Tax=Cellulosimicrobium composti TaxID=2672572 RepID=A0ABX0BB58_9MICO|nr:hypothetical protein [Cellulosimicrobium composti]NDO88188.1 hypothetical protein [Cellulosimicrobium composti]
MEPSTESFDADDVQTFLTTYGVALSTGDLDTIGESYAFPALVVGTTDSVLLTDPEAVRESTAELARGFRERGLVGVVAHLVGVEEVGDALVWVHARWSFRDEYANEQEAQEVRYLLRRARDTFEVCVVAPVAS